MPRRGMANRVLLTGIAAAGVVLSGLGSGLSGESLHPVCVLIFLSKDCPGCKPIEKASIEELARKLRCEIRTQYLSVDNPDEYGKLVKLEQQLGDEGNEIPVVFLGKHVLGGKAEIEKSFAAHVERYAREGGAENFPELSPASTAPSPSLPRPAGGGNEKPVYVAYFDSPGCKECRRVEYMLQSIGRDFPTMQVRKFVTSDHQSQLVQEAISHLADVPEKRRLLTPTIVVGREPFVQEEITDRRVRECLARLAPRGTECPWEGDLGLKAAAERLAVRMRSISLGAVVVGGLLDGINPCAFATLILFVSYVQSARRDRRQVLAVGLAFIAAVFLSYLAVGLGLSEAARLVERVPFLDTAVTWGIALLCIVLSALSVQDAVIAARGQHKAIWLQLPRSFKDRIQQVVLRFRKTRYLILGGLVMGALISMLELVCTGQIYFPLIKYMVASGTGSRARAIGLLFVYNLCFVVPLLAILAAAHLGASSERLIGILKRNMAATKAATAVFFAGLAALMIISHYLW